MWTMDELVERVARALAAEYPGAPNGRVRELPDRRAIRWYTTTGLVDRPLGMRGRSALYGRRHLLQLVAVKKRQALGLPLAAIQAELQGASDEVLAEVAGVPDEVLAGAEPAPVLAASAAPARFWAAAPKAAAPPGMAAQAKETATAKEPAQAGTSAPAGTSARADDDVRTKSKAVPLGAVQLTGGAVLVLPGMPDAADRAAIAAAAGPLLDLLADRGLLTFDDGSPS